MCQGLAATHFLWRDPYVTNKSTAPEHLPGAPFTDASKADVILHKEKSV